MTGNVVSFPGSSPARSPAEPAEKLNWRTRELVQKDINRHVAARRAYAMAVAWEAEAENLGQGQLEEARKSTAKAFEEMEWWGRVLLVTMPTDPKGLVDLLMYLEKNFSVLPQELCGRSLALELLRTMRLSLRRIARDGKIGPE
jgi:hypothetical protein